MKILQIRCVVPGCSNAVYNQWYYTCNKHVDCCQMCDKFYNDCPGGHSRVEKGSLEKKKIFIDQLREYLVEVDL